MGNTFLNHSIPDNWEVKRVASLTLDHKQGYYTKDEYQSDGEYHLIRGKDLKSPEVQWKNSPKINAKTEDYNLYKVEVGDFLFVRSGNIGEYGIVRTPIPPSIFASYLIRFRLNNELVLNYFFGSFYGSNFCLNQLNKITQGSSNININANNIKSLKIPVPPLQEQKAIAHVLGSMDKAINANNQLIAQKELHKKWLMQNLLTGKKRLKGFSEEWQEYHLGEMFAERNERNNVELPLLSIGQNGVYPQGESIKKDTSNTDKSKYKKICIGDIGYNTMRMWQGRSALSSLEGIVSPAYTILKPKQNADALFFSYLFKTPKLVNLFWRNSQGLVGDTLNCKYKDFSIVKAFLPLKDEQTAIAKILQTADKELDLLNAKTDKLKEQKKGMMQVLLTGKKRLPYE